MFGRILIPFFVRMKKIKNKIKIASKKLRVLKKLKYFLVERIVCILMLIINSIFLYF